jgi:lysosomal acid lipase/cholesteryl ester hydrolase
MCTTAPEMIELYGFHAETHTVTTSDGYILPLFRLRDRNLSQPLGTPVALQHGMLGSADEFLYGGNKSLAIVLAKSHYDVWLLNVRGTRYGKNHTHLHIDSPEFWDFTFEEMGKYDMIANLDYIRQKTQRAKIAFVGFSQGNTQMFAAFALNPQSIIDRVSTIIAAAPVIRFDFTKNVYLIIFSIIHVARILEFFTGPEIMRLNYPSCKWSGQMCALLPGLCKFFLSVQGDWLPWYDDDDSLPVYYSHYPAGTGAKALEHILSLIRWGGFYRYPTKPNDPLVPYDLDNIHGVPISLILGDQDEVATPLAGQWLYERLHKKMKTEVTYHNCSKFGHTTFLIPKDSSCFHNAVIAALGPPF